MAQGPRTLADSSVASDSKRRDNPVAPAGGPASAELEFDRKKEAPMFGMSGTELVIVLLVALLLLGPAKLPELARSLGKGLRDFRKATDDVRNTVESEFYKLDQPPPPKIPQPYPYPPPTAQPLPPGTPEPARAAGAAAAASAAQTSASDSALPSSEASAAAPSPQASPPGPAVPIAPEPPPARPAEASTEAAPAPEAAPLAAPAPTASAADGAAKT